MKDAKELFRTIQLEPIEENIFRGPSHSIGGRRVFGGQVLAQSLSAAIQTVPQERLVHSMHGYFILPGDVTKPIIYEVDRTRDGGSFTTRRVKAIQSGAAIFTMAASFQKEEEGFDHAISMPNVPPPEALQDDIELMKKYSDQLPSSVRDQLDRPRPIEFRSVEKSNLLDPGSGPPFRHVWMKTNGQLSDDQHDHRTLLAYASDYNLLVTALRPHPITFGQLMMASLDHAMWFHRSFRIDEWLLYAIDSPSASNARGFTRGNIFTKDGKLVASVTQEGLMRRRVDK